MTLHPRFTIHTLAIVVTLAARSARSDEAGREQQSSRSRIDHMRPQPTSKQFSLRQLMLATAACAVLAFLWTVSPEVVVGFVVFLAIFACTVRVAPPENHNPAAVTKALAEVLVVLAIIGTLIALLLPPVMS